MADVDDGPKKKVAIDGVECVECHSIVALESKFCGECGAKVVSKAGMHGSEKKAA